MQEYSDKEKVLIIFSICFLHFYSNFSYENSFTFEEFFNQNLINLCTRYNVYVKDLKQFKIFCYSFYYQLIKEIKNIDYSRFKNMYNFYNSSAWEEEKKLINEKDQEENISQDGSQICFLKIVKNYITKFNTYPQYQNLKTNLKKLVDKKILTPLVSTTERVVDMVLSVNFFNLDRNKQFE